MNFIVIVSDTFRFDHLGANGHAWIKTPELDALAPLLAEAGYIHQLIADNPHGLPATSLSRYNGGEADWVMRQGNHRWVS